MLKKVKPKNSTVILVGIILISIGILIGLIEFFQEKKEKAFSDMNILLFESETPKTITKEEEKKEETKQEEPKQEQPQQQSQKQTRYDYAGILEIPKIGIKRGFLNQGSRYNNVDYNITVIQGSTLPDTENNNLILAAHSGNCSYCYFDSLYKLVKGDTASIYYNNIKYNYSIVDIYDVEKDGTVTIYRDYSKNVLTLITCTRNSKTKQTVYILELTGKQNY